MQEGHLEYTVCGAWERGLIPSLAHRSVDLIGWWWGRGTDAVPRFWVRMELLRTQKRLNQQAFTPRVGSIPVAGLRGSN